MQTITVHERRETSRPLFSSMPDGPRAAVWRNVTYDLNGLSAAAYVARYRFAWPGGYALYAVTDDGAALCPNCCRSEYRRILESHPGDGWRVIGIDIVFSDEHEQCSNCDATIA